MNQQTNFERKGTRAGKVRGLGSAHHGSHHWLLQRFTAAGNLVTVLYLAFSILLLQDLSYQSAFRWLSQPAGALPLALLIVSVFWHARLGLQVMIEDYVHGQGTRFAAMLTLNLATFAAAGYGLLCLVLIVSKGMAINAAQGAIGQAMQAMQSGMGGGM
jgi:succinate dehydrogenase / fumarate reductase membrane anchor subunit